VAGFIRERVLKASYRLEAIGFLLLLGYLVFIPSGPYPIPIIAGLNLDVFLGILLCAFVVIYSSRITRYPNLLIETWLLYFFIVFISAILSVDFDYSIRYAFVIFGYSLTALLVPVIYVNRADAIRKWLFLAAILVSILIIYLHFVHGVGQEYRFWLISVDMPRGDAGEMGYDTVDPNMTAAGLVLSLIAYFPSIFVKRRWIVPELLGSLLILEACVITLSRSAILAFAVAIGFSYVIVLTRSLGGGTGFVMKKSMAISFFLALVVISSGVLIVLSVAPGIVDNLAYRFIRVFDDSARIALMLKSWTTFTADIKTIVIGSGFMTENPHNEYLRTISTMGFLGVFSSILFHGAMFYIAIRQCAHNSRRLFSVLSIISFMMVAAMFYGYTKLMWVAWMFLMFSYTESRFMFRQTRNFKVDTGSEDRQLVGIGLS